MKENLSFFFNNESSDNMGLTNVNIEGGMLTERLLATRELSEEIIRGRTKSYFLSVEQKPFEFTMAFAFLNNFTNEDLRRVARWLNVEYYKEFYFIDNPSFRFFVMPVTESMIVHNGLNQGYITITMRTNDAFAYSEEFLTEEFDLSTNTDLGTSIKIENLGDMPIAYEMWIKKVGDGDITIRNIDFGDDEFKIVNLHDIEEVYVNHEREDIVSNFPNLYHFDDVQTDYMKLPVGMNTLLVLGTCKIQFRYRFKYLLGM
jgi:phage-related protein